MTPPSLRDALEQAILLSVGAASLTRERVEQIVGELVAQGRVSAEDGRVLMERLIARVVEPPRTSTSGLKAVFEDSVRGMFADAGVVTRTEVEDLRVHLAELDHRVRLLEGSDGDAAPGEDAPPAVQ